MNKKIDITTDNSKLDIKIAHCGLSGKFKDGTLNLIFILLGMHVFKSILLFGPTDFFFFTKIFNCLFFLWEILFACLITYSYFGFTRIVIDSENFIIEKGIGRIIKEVNGKTANVGNIEIKPIEVFIGQYNNRLFGFSSEKSASYACYLFPDTAYCFGAMCDRQDLERVVSHINSYLKSLSTPDTI